jgi:hypothetical protein
MIELRKGGREGGKEGGREGKEGSHVDKDEYREEGGREGRREGGREDRIVPGRVFSMSCPS